MTASLNRFSDLRKNWLWWLTVSVLLVVAVARLRLASFPLERDEGEYAYAGQLILQGIPPYELAYNMKFPGTYLAYAAMMAVFGQTPVGIHIGLLVVTMGTSLMLFWLGRRMLDDIAGMVAAASYALLAAGPSMLGQAGHATHFCAFFATAGLCLMWRMRQKETWLNIIGSGICFGLAVLMKQHAVIIAAWAGFSYAFGKLFLTGGSLGRRLWQVVVYALAMLSPLMFCCLWFWCAGVLATFRFWVFDYALAYASMISLHKGSGLFWNNFTWVVTSGVILWLLAAVGFAVVCVDRRWEHSRVWFLGFCLALALAVCPDFYFRPHYFLIITPALALLSGAAVSGICQWRLGKIYMPVIYVLVIVVTIMSCAEVWFFMPRSTFARKMYGVDPLTEAEAVARFIRENSLPSARLAVLGSQPEIYFLSRRHSATGYIYLYALNEDQPFAEKMMRQMISEIEAVRPEYIVVCGMERWMNEQPPSTPGIFNWWDSYQTNYVRVGVADIISSVQSRCSFGPDELARHGQIHRSALEVFQLQTPASSKNP